MQIAKNEVTTYLCLNCSKKNGGCCSGEFSVPVTIKDIKRIEKMGYKKESFLTLQKYSKREIIGPERWWINSFIDIHGVKYKIQLKVNERRCPFLHDRKGCILGNKRPSFCRIYPFWVEKNKIIIEKGDGIYCPVNLQKLTLINGMKIMNETPNKIRSYFLEIKEDCIKNKKQHEKMAKIIKSKCK